MHATAFALALFIGIYLPPLYPILNTVEKGRDMWYKNRWARKFPRRSSEMIWMAILTIQFTAIPIG
ncbi:hypothetical protein J7M22_05635 [Candidatus Poribacteria bacterium]|nr:hypothetical protein [Candidatus Poribacteria bacterium]